MSDVAVRDKQEALMARPTWNHLLQALDKSCNVDLNLVGQQPQQRAVTLTNCLFMFVPFIMCARIALSWLYWFELVLGSSETA